MRFFFFRLYCFEDSCRNLRLWGDKVLFAFASTVSYHLKRFATLRYTIEESFIRFSDNAFSQFWRGQRESFEFQINSF